MLSKNRKITLFYVILSNLLVQRFEFICNWPVFEVKLANFGPLKKRGR